MNLLLCPDCPRNPRVPFHIGQECSHHEITIGAGIFQCKFALSSSQMDTLKVVAKVVICRASISIFFTFLEEIDNIPVSAS
jgi:hypothetical protein